MPKKGLYGQRCLNSNLKFAFVRWLHPTNKTIPYIFFSYCNRIEVSWLLLNLIDECHQIQNESQKTMAYDSWNKRSIHNWYKKQLTLLDIGWPKGSGRIVTTPLSASSKIVADTVVLIGTPSLLWFMNKIRDEQERKPARKERISVSKNIIYLLSAKQEKRQ